MNEVISVIVPVYNVEKYIKACVDSIRRQSYKNLEIILVDDGSSDSSGRICDEYKLIDSRIVVVHQENRGLSGARNSGLEIAKGKYVSFVDSDDEVDPLMYESMSCFISDCDVIECGVQRFVKEKEVYRVSSVPNTIKRLNKMEALENLVCNPGMTASFCNKLFRINLFDELRFEEGIIHEDEHLIFRILDRIDNYGYINAEFYCYRTRANSIMTTQLSMKQLDAVYVWEDRYEYCKKKQYMELMLRTQAALYYECCNLYKKDFFRKDSKANKYLTDKIEKYQSELIHNPYVKVKHKIVLRLGRLYRYIL